MSRKDRGVVYSTDHGRVCPECGEPTDDCRCVARLKSAASSGNAQALVRVLRTTKGRKGKTVSVISGLQINALELAELARELKQRCGTGGTAKNDTIEIQGDHVETLIALLRARGFDAK
jgi:translation initiation factor 1